MYDTVSVLLTQVPEDVLDERRWSRSSVVVNRDTGEVSRRSTMNSPGGLLLTLHGGGRALQAERSLPKVYRGENITDLVGPEVAVALGAMDGEIADALGTWSLPSVAEWSPVRADYPWSLHLADEVEVTRTLDKWAGIEMPYKGLPVKGQSHSVTWSKGNVKLKAYSKYRETRGDARALGVLRVEPGVFRIRTFRELLGRASDAEVRLLDVLTPAFHGICRAKFEARLRGAVMTGQELTDMQLVREMYARFGSRRTATMLGWAVLYGVNNVKSREDMLSIGVGSLATRYRIVADYRVFREHLLERGFDLSDEGTEAADIEWIMPRVRAAA